MEGARRAAGANALRLGNGGNLLDTIKICVPNLPKTSSAYSGTDSKRGLHIAKMAAAGYATGTVIQAILNTLGLGPDRVFGLMMKTRLLCEIPD